MASASTNTVHTNANAKKVSFLIQPIARHVQILMSVMLVMADVLTNRKGVVLILKAPTNVIVMTDINLT